MVKHKPIFISAVSKELKSARQLVAQTLRFLGYPTIEQEIFPLEGGDLREVLRGKIKQCIGVVQLVGNCYGAEPPDAARSLNRMSYTQFEAEYAKQRKLKVWYILLDEGFPTDAHEEEPQTLRDLQAAYRERIRSESHIFHPVDSSNALELRILKFRDEFRGRWWRAVARNIVSKAAMLAILGGVGWLLWALVISPQVFGSADRIPRGNRLSVESGWWARDDFVAVRVAESVKGTILGDEPYELQLEIKNPTIMPTTITRITVLSQNEEAAQLFGSADPHLFTAEIHIPQYLEANGATTVPVRLNQFLPRKLTTKIYHNHADKPSEFSIDLNSEVIPMPAPRYLAREQVFSGCDSLKAIHAAVEAARAWSDDVVLAASFPGDNSVYIDPESRLKYTEVTSWVNTFYSPVRNREYMVILNAQVIVEQFEVGTPPEPDHIPPRDVQSPVLGFQQALDIANRSSLLSADWGSVRYAANRFGDQNRCAWFLPYRSSDGLPVVIDAVNGNRLIPSLDSNGKFREHPLDPIPALQ